MDYRVLKRAGVGASNGAVPSATATSHVSESNAPPPVFTTSTAQRTPEYEPMESMTASNGTGTGFGSASLHMPPVAKDDIAQEKNKYQVKYKHDTATAASEDYLSRLKGAQLSGQRNNTLAGARGGAYSTSSSSYSSSSSSSVPVVSNAAFAHTTAPNQAMPRASISANGGLTASRFAVRDVGPEDFKPCAVAFNRLLRPAKSSMKAPGGMGTFSVASNAMTLDRGPSASFSNTAVTVAATVAAPAAARTLRWKDAAKVNGQWGTLCTRYFFEKGLEDASGVED